MSQDDAEISKNNNDSDKNLIIKDINTFNSVDKNSGDEDDTTTPDYVNYTATTVDQALLKTSPKLDKILTVQLGDRCDSPEFFSEYSKKTENFKPLKLTDALSPIHEPTQIQNQEPDSSFLKTYKIPKKKITEMDVEEGCSGTLEDENERTPGASPSKSMLVRCV